MSKKSENYSGIYKDMVEVLGEEITLKIYENYRGQQVTFPMRLYSKSYILEYLNKNYSSCYNIIGDNNEKESKTKV